MLQILQPSLSQHLPGCGMEKAEGAPWLPGNGLGAALHHLHSLETQLESSSPHTLTQAQLKHRPPLLSAPCYPNCHTVCLTRNEPASDEFTIYCKPPSHFLANFTGFSQGLFTLPTSVRVEGSVPHLLSFLVYCLCFSFHRLITNISLCELPLYGGCVISAP